MGRRAGGWAGCLYIINCCPDVVRCEVLARLQSPRLASSARPPLARQPAVYCLHAAHPYMPTFSHSVPNPASAQVSNMVTELSPELRATATNDARRGAVADATNTAAILAEASQGPAEIKGRLKRPLGAVMWSVDVRPHACKWCRVWPASTCAALLRIRCRPQRLSWAPSRASLTPTLPRPPSRWASPTPPVSREIGDARHGALPAGRASLCDSLACTPAGQTGSCTVAGCCAWHLHPPCSCCPPAISLQPPPPLPALLLPFNPHSSHVLWCAEMAMAADAGGMAKQATPVTIGSADVTASVSIQFAIS